MIERAEDAGIQVFHHLVLLAYLLHVLVVELQRTVEIGIERRGGEGFVPDEKTVFQFLQDGGILFNAGQFLLTALRGEGVGSHFLDQRHFVEVAELFDETALLAALQAFGAGIVEQVDAPGAADATVEIIRPHGVLLLVGGQAEAQAQVEGNERSAHAARREDAFSDREQDDGVEVEGAGFQRAHDLQAAERFAFKGNLDQRDVLGQEPVPGPGLQRLQRESHAFQFAHGFVVMIEELAFQRALAGLHLLQYGFEPGRDGIGPWDGLEYGGTDTAGGGQSFGWHENQVFFADGQFKGRNLLRISSCRDIGMLQ